MALLSVCPAHTDQGSPLCPCEFPSSKGTAGSPTLSLFHPLPNDSSNSLSFKDFSTFGQSCARPKLIETEVCAQLGERCCPCSNRVGAA